MLVVSGVGAGAGFWTWLGFVLTDLAFTDRSSVAGLRVLQGCPARWLLGGYVPLFMSYLLLAALLVLGPLLGTGFAGRTAMALRKLGRRTWPASPGRPYTWSWWPASRLPGPKRSRS